MKTLMTAALLAALTLTAAAFGQEPGKPDAKPTGKADPAKAGKKVTIEDLGDMLHAMGYETKPINDANGRLLGYSVTFNVEGYTIYGTFQITSDGRVWIYGTLAGSADESTPPSVLLAMLAANDRIFPAFITYETKSKTLVVMLPIANGNVTPVGLRGNIDTYVNAVKVALTTLTAAKNKADAVAKERAEKAEGRPQK